MNNITFDSEKFYLGKLCPCSHDWNGTGQSLRQKSSRGCILCQKKNQRRHYEKKAEKKRTGEIRNKYYLGRLCKNRHEWEGSGKSLRNILNNGCMICQRENVNRWRKNHLEEVRIRDNEYNKLPHRREARLRLYRKNHTEILRKRAEWRRKNVYRLRVLERDNYRKNRDSRCDSARRSHHKRRALSLSNHHVYYSKDTVKERFLEFDNSCAYCGRVAKTTDHFIPISKGGPDCLGNLLPCCKSCNSSKHNKDVKSWYESQRFYSKERWDKILKILGKKGSSYNQIPLL